MNHSEFSSTSSASPFLFMDKFLATNHVICIVIGIPLNFLTAAFIIFSPRLHQTRNISWLGVGFSNVFVLFAHSIEWYAYQFQCETAKKMFSVVAGLPYASLMFNLFLSLIDRYVSISYSTWYKRNITINWIVSAQIVCFAVICVLIKGPYLIELIPVPLRVTTIEVKLFSSIGFIILLFCISGQIFVYVKVKGYSIHAQNVKRREKNKRKTDIGNFARQKNDIVNCLTQERVTEFHEGGTREIDLNNIHSTLFLQHPDVSASPHCPVLTGVTKTHQEKLLFSSKYFIQAGSQTISVVELKSACQVLDSVTLLLLFTLPVFVIFSFAISADCFLVTTQNAIHYQHGCSTYLWIFAYTRGLLLIYVIANPLFFVGCSQDLLRALNRFCKN